ncbi:pyruvate dehydrogenase (acetyl-transferring) E1 component subunit alpha [Cellulomonas sp. zg-ZUI222]|uniref:Pyruvate dehydrogenase (Acetyl-transferring) E1 component subunit alpha n=1 Tax=Cellulomonas wangleii TaxID=2816956 RepID=A0ABX8D534_9CELL|nr:MULTISPECIES: pyruvate dehydrogenase (acetyl-transferring) E1 component subunit alpha [Cellulomonas]MBO0898823.1 pyruvate dehydrogenase (acetyl-transferring) E1 component subunit alpha [Cellulomonas sp. zg-ZUI22]MBO0919685.1 pyruvate dehydrogenase (acetyl-transferring) E1 component subunit alpha [Cellulomonas wangleii]MBO0923888.1 pyruvate dehydrogenase (acetyl-transferring) E1 component subunit alpha [Cellulomonas wangleii]MBO0924170.1 pyruvate dehydrogenase (acetyl-transferring) E1 compone
MSTTVPAAEGPLTDEGLVQLLTPTGERVHHPEYDGWAADLDADRLRAMYRDMVLTRRFDTEATSLQRQGELGLWAQSLGQEAAQVGSGHALAPQDHVFPSYREHGVAHVRGLEMTDLLRLFRGVDHGGWDPAAHGFHLFTLVIGSHTLHATGYAMGVQRDGLVGTGDPTRDTAVVTYFGDGATAQGDVSEALVFASVNQAPVVLFCQNNQFAISEPTTRQARVPLADRAPGFGIPSVRVDGNDVLASYAVTRQALERARSGGGPTFVEAFTYRMGAHTTSDDPTRYRTSEQEEHWRRRDPIERLRVHLDRTGELPEVFQAQLAAESDAFGEHIRTTVRAMGHPSSHSMFEHVYATPHAVVDAERAWFTQYEQSFVDHDGRETAGGHR